MKKLLCLLLSLFCLTGCQPVGQGQPEPMDIPKDEYVWAEAGATILLPEGTMTYCDVHIAESGALWFDFKDGGDTAFWLEAWEKKEWKNLWRNSWAYLPSEKRIPM